MDIEEKKVRLMEYTVRLRQLERKCEEAARWDSMAESGEQDGSNRIKVTAIQIRGECETLAEQVRTLRSRLVSALNCIDNERQREVLELYYLHGATTLNVQQAHGWSSRYIRMLRTAAIQTLDKQSDFFRLALKNEN